MRKIINHITSPVSITPLATFRLLFGFIMLVSILRFMINGWVYDQYIMPKVFFPYFGAEWIRPLGETGMYALFGLMALAALMIMLGLFYRIFSVLFFLSFTYAELIDKTNYLNHYYFVSIIAFLLILVPAHRYFSLDILRKPSLKLREVPAWTIGVFKCQLGIVYFYAGLAKLNPEWLFEALPLKIWLPANQHFPIIGPLLQYSWVAFAFSWFGAVYDLCIPFFLLYRKTRLYAYAFVILFHISTWLLFPIGMFPFIMILSTLIFFSASVHEKIINGIISVFKSLKILVRSRPAVSLTKYTYNRALLYLLGIHFVIQLLLPFRFSLYPGKLFWTEEGYRFSWRVMLMEKAGYVIFHIEDPETGRKGEAYAHDYLTPNQEKMMSTQPDMILQFAHFLKREYQQKGIKNPIVRAEAYVTLNGSGSRLFIDPTVNLANEKESFKHKSWILPYEENKVFNANNF